MSSSKKETIPRKFEVPHTYVILFIIIVLATIGTYFIPAGVYDRVKDAITGRTIVDVASFHYVDQTPVSFFNMFKAIPLGMIRAANIVFLVFIMGGAFTMIKSTGSIDAGISRVIDKFRDRDKLIIPVIMFLFSILGFTIGAAEEVIPFVPIAIALSRGFGYDDIVGVAMVSTGAAIGFSGGMLNPFTVGVAQGISELPLYSALAYRSIFYVVLYVIAVWYVLRYAAKVKADPTSSVLYGIERDYVVDDTEISVPEFTGRHKLELAVLIAGVAYMVYGVLKQGWYINEISALFILLAIIVSIIGRRTMNQMARSFVQGARDICFGALVVGIARVILVVMEQGQIMDSMIHGLAMTVSWLPNQITAVGMFVVNSIINFFIPSGSGQAATVMPIMSPLADVLGITRQTAVLAFQYGDAFSNQIIPTSGALLGILALAKVPYDRWLKYNWKLVALWSLVGAVSVFVASLIELGPF
jgi:uncharacterized ion transporter superfamily protein YfcC